jgi:hypothetical protein
MNNNKKDFVTNNGETLFMANKKGAERLLFSFIDSG